MVKRGLIRDLARQRINLLFQLALRTYKSDPLLANRYVDIALRISRKTRVRVPARYRLLYCKKCGSLLVPGRTARVRVRGRRERHLVVKCLKCGRVVRRPLPQSRPQT